MIDKVLSNDLWKNPTIVDKQKTCLIKFQRGQYVGYTHKKIHDYMHYFNEKNMAYIVPLIYITTSNT